ncbi:MAG: hypothetical protein ACM3Z4_19275, partial [Hyphomicrobiales bacterium]
MSNQTDGNGPDDTLRPRVVMMETPREPRVGGAQPLAPRVIASAQTGRIVPAAPAEPQRVADPARRRRRSLTVKLGLAGLIAAVCGWLGVDLYLWIQVAFNFSTGLGLAAAAAVVVGIAAAAAIIGHELRSYLAL